MESPTVGPTELPTTAQGVHLGNVALMCGVSLVWLLAAWLHPPLSVLGLPLAVAAGWAICYAFWPNLTKYATVLGCVTAIGLSLLLPGLLLIRERARSTQSTEHLRSQWGAIHGWQTLQEVRPSRTSPSSSELVPANRRIAVEPASGSSDLAEQ